MKDNLKSRLLALGLPLLVAGCGTVTHTTNNSLASFVDILPQGSEETRSYTIGDKKVVIWETSEYAGEGSKYAAKPRSIVLDVHAKNWETTDYNAPHARIEDDGRNGTVDRVTIYENSDVFKEYDASNPSDAIVIREAQKKFDNYISQMKNQVGVIRAKEVSSAVSKL